jgi:serine phosphatase RsbU (regulator of sigma subunit)/anti-sigma regulatory factor (Ser/Thr protein kinase)
MIVMSSAANKSLIIEAPSRLDAVRDAARVVRSFLASNGVEEADMDSWELVAVEAGNNAVQYTSPSAKNSGSDHSVRFLMNAWEDCVELCVTDHSKGFDWPEESTLPPEDSEQGRGIFLITALTNAARYVRGSSENFLIMRKDRNKKRGYADVQRDADLEHTINLMTEELGASFESLSAIVSFSTELGRAEDFGACAAKWLKELLKSTGTHWYELRQYNRESGTLKVVVSSLPRDVSEPAIMLDTDYSGGLPVEIQAITEGKDIWFDDKTASSTMANLERTFGKPISGFSHPIYVGSQLFGVLSIGVNHPKADLTISRINVIHTFAGFLAIQMCNTQAQKEALQSRVIGRELQIAANIQRSLLPKKLPQPTGWTLSAHSESANHVGGDFYDAAVVDENSIVIAIADVMGKGVPAAMFAAIFRSHLLARPELAPTPGKLLSWMNRVLFSDLSGVDMFVTAQVVHIDLITRKVTMASAGHCPLFVVDGPKNKLSEHSSDGSPLGIAIDSMYPEETFQLGPNARLMMFTDGLVEVRNASGRAFGSVTAADLLKTSAIDELDATTSVQTILDQIAEFQNGTASTDDISLVLLAESNLSPTPPSYNL